ncbi:MAG TPA: hypothetical protein GXZ28_07580 [Clostridiales bacterium]|jgi:hypothetical protein|nr:hypothetical protein [Clostridiales bacterium]
MIKIENIETYGWEAAIRGMRNPMNSWDKSDTAWVNDPDAQQKAVAYNSEGSALLIGDNDRNLMKRLAKAGNDHGKFLRFICVTLDINAPLYWWKEFDTYKVGTVANSCSTMHKIHATTFTLDDFSHEHLTSESLGVLENLISILNGVREKYLETKDKQDWWQMIQLLPSSYNQRRTVHLNYAVLKNMYHARKNHKLDEWLDFCKWVRELPYAKEWIVGDSDSNN